MPIAIAGNGFAAPPSFVDLFYVMDANGEINITYPLSSLIVSAAPFGLAAINASPASPGNIAITNGVEITVVP